MKSIKSFATMSALVLASTTLPLSAMAGGSAAGSGSGAYTSGSAMSPTQTMMNHTNGIVGGGSTPLMGSIKSPTPTSIMSVMAGIPPNTNVIFQGPTTSIPATTQDGGSMSINANDVPDSLKP